ncbi:phosphotransferase [Brachybacterium phenoliresistens]|uniref:Serine kinase n=1 Tax=Brachybacterium phenoliresistens TaxID=396014 RepID=Z9JU72_9MICO|nr:phosphotransferase [Brachybacterium phenoliresistens]EWS81920.1 serine kinase [Brachybacterium phenoliresistens]
MSVSRDGSELLTGPDAGGLLNSAVSNAGGVLRSWELDHVDHRPGRSTKALYRTTVSWPELDGPSAPAREELFGASAHIGEAERHVAGAEHSLVMTDGDINVRVWRYPHDPWLPMLPRVCYPDVLGTTLAELGVPTGMDAAAPVPIEVVSYRPGRRAVLRARLADRAVFLKVMQPHKSGEIVDRHQRLLAAGVPVPQVTAHHQGLVVMEELPGRPLAHAVVEEGARAVRAEDLVATLDRLPASMYTLPLRAPWTDSADFYAGVVSSSVPALAPRIETLVRGIRDGLAAVGRRLDMRPHDVVHGDFYEAQLFVQGGEVVGVLDIDTVGPGRRADDLACLLAHLSVLADYGSTGRISAPAQAHVEEAIRVWHEVFARRVDATELALRAAGVVLSLATGPHRQQENAWEAATEAIIRVAERWVETAREAERRLQRAQREAQEAREAQAAREARQAQLQAEAERARAEQARATPPQTGAPQAPHGPPVQQGTPAPHGPPAPPAPHAPAASQPLEGPPAAQPRQAPPGQDAQDPGTPWGHTVPARPVDPIVPPAPTRAAALRPEDTAPRSASQQSAPVYQPPEQQVASGIHAPLAPSSPVPSTGGQQRGPSAAPAGAPPTHESSASPDAGDESPTQERPISSIPR